MPPRTPASARFRYGAVLGLTVALLLFLVAAPTADWSRAVALGLQGASLVIVVVTSGGAPARRRERTVAAVAGTVLVLVLIAVGVVPDGVAALLLALVTAAVLIALVRGLALLVRTRGVTLQAVAGGLAIYLLAGLAFAWVIAVTTDVSSAPFFAQGTDATLSKRVYYSFSVLTTTGFGDLSAGTGAARALAVLEMLMGQLYLVTVIGVLVGDFAGRARRDRAG